MLMFPLFVIWKIRGSLAEPSLIWLTVLSFVDGSDFARVFLTCADRCKLQSFVRPVGAVHLTAGLDEVRVPGPNQTN